MMKRLGVAVLVLLLLGALLIAGWLLTHRAGGEPVVSGTIETDEIRVASRYGGRVQALHANEGQPLEAGQILVTLDAAELNARRAAAAAKLAELEAGPRTNEILAAQHEWEAAQSEWSLAMSDADRARDLFATKTISEEERDRALTRVRSLEQQTKAAEARYELLREGTRPERIAQARATVQELDAQLAEMEIHAPAGRGTEAPPTFILETLPVRVGDVVLPGQPVAVLVRPDDLWARVYVPEPWLGHIRLGQSVRVRADSHKDRTFEGVVEQINRQAEFTPRNVQTVEDRVRQVFGVKLRFRDPGQILRPGMAIDAEFSNVPAAPPER